jgi:O-antigen chain-terminating methyltransferase
MAAVDRHLPLWRSIKAQQRQIDALASQTAQQAARIEGLLNEQRELRRRFADDDQARMAAWYQALQDDYRGHGAEVGHRFQNYLDELASIPQDLLARAPIVDLGCGAGDWLCVLKMQGMDARGVDSSADAVRRARAQFCDVECGDLLEYLEALPSGGVAAVTSMQVVEHLPWPAVFRLFSEAFRVLAPGGLLLIETPNPENLQVSGYGFWLDPTHRRPMPSPLLLHLAKFLGFDHCRVLRSVPWPQWVSAADNAPHTADAENADETRQAAGEGAMPEPLNTLLYGPQDYTLVARRPSA